MGILYLCNLILHMNICYFLWTYFLKRSKDLDTNYFNLQLQFHILKFYNTFSYILSESVSCSPPSHKIWLCFADNNRVIYLECTSTAGDCLKFQGKCTYFMLYFRCLTESKYWRLSAASGCCQMNFESIVNVLCFCFFFNVNVKNYANSSNR